MTRFPCPFPGCARHRASETSAFCFEHHVQADPKKARSIIRMKIERKRFQDAETLDHLDQAIAKLTREAVNSIREKVNA